MVKDMTEGKVGGLLLGFTIPLVLGNLFQLFYNAADSSSAVSVADTISGITVHSSRARPRMSRSFMASRM